MPIRHWTRALGQLHATQMLVLSFAAAILVGAALLSLPISTRGASLGAIDALFMATSAVCVTGLSVVDVGAGLTPFGQGVLLALVQLGALGIMTYSSLLAMLLHSRLSLRSETVVQETFGARRRLGAASLVRDVVVFTLGCELVGAVMLALAMARTRPWAEAVYAGVFHAISAFCNAGFSLYADSLSGFRGDWAVNLIVAGLIVTGGLGFAVIADLRAAGADWRARRRVHLMVHTRVMLVASAVAILLGAVAVWAFERTNALAGLGRGETVLACLFQSITARTAGFNTLDYGTLTTPSLVLTIMLMFVGAGSGSCAGGVKLSSAVVLGASLWHRLNGRERVSLLQRTVPDETVDRALAIVLGSIAFIVFAVFLLATFEAPLVPHRQTGGLFIELLFETVSAFGTVGLSTGLTTALHHDSRLLLAAVMFVGRLGPLTVALAVSRRASGRFAYASENIMVG